MACLAIAVAIAASHAAVAGAQASPGTSLRIEQLGADPLPYQAVRVRIILRYESEGILANLPMHGLRFFIGPVNKESQPVRGVIPSPNRESSVISTENVWSIVDSDLHYNLSKAEQVTWSYVFSWHELGVLNPKSRAPLFPEPGSYELRVEYRLPDQANYPGYLRKAGLKIRVPEPVGDDKIVYQLLKENQELAHELALPIHDPLDSVYDQIREIVQKYPESSYANYARFALARRHLHGTGYNLWDYLWSSGQSVKREQVKKLIEPYALKVNAETDIDSLAREFGQNFGLRGIGGRRLEEVRDAFASAKDPRKRQDSVELLTDMLWVSPQDRRAAQRLLVGVLDRDFAYYPNVLASLKMSLLGGDREWEKRINAEMDEKYYDDFVWLWVRRHEITQRRPWRDFRIRYVPKAPKK